jgi:hypothetical protein
VGTAAVGGCCCSATAAGGASPTLEMEGAGVLVVVDGGGVGLRPSRSRIVPQACRIRSARVSCPMPRPSAPSGVGEVGLEVKDGVVLLVLVAGAVPGGARPEERMGSEDPVSKEAAVAAAATLKEDTD